MMEKTTASVNPKLFGELDSENSDQGFQEEEEQTNQEETSESQELAAGEDTESQTQTEAVEETGEEKSAETEETAGEEQTVFTPDMLAELNRLASGSNFNQEEQQVIEQQKSKETVEPKTEETRTNERSSQEIDFTTDLGEDFDFSDKTQVNKLLNRVYSHGVNTVLRRTAVIVPQLVQQQNYLHGLVHDFYTENPDLLPYKNLVMRVAHDVVAAKPELNNDPKKLFEETGSEFRKRYGKQKTSAGSKTTQRPPVRTGAPQKRPAVEAKPKSTRDEDMAMFSSGKRLV